MIINLNYSPLSTFLPSVDWLASICFDAEHRSGAVLRQSLFRPMILALSFSRRFHFASLSSAMIFMVACTGTGFSRSPPLGVNCAGLGREAARGNKFECISWLWKITFDFHLHHRFPRNSLHVIKFSEVFYGRLERVSWVDRFSFVMHFASCLGDEAGNALKAEIVASGYIKIFGMEFRLEELWEMRPIARALKILHLRFDVATEPCQSQIHFSQLNRLFVQNKGIKAIKFMV